MTKIALLGCGALGSQIGFHLASPEHAYTLWDDDRVEPHNLPTTIYSFTHCGALKVEALAEILYRKASCEFIGLFPYEFNRRCVAGLATIDLAVVTFDNEPSRALLTVARCPVVQVGVSPSRLGVISWDSNQFDPQGEPRGEGFCTRLVGRQILRITAALAATVIEDYLATGNKRSLVVNEKGKIYE